MNKPPMFCRICERRIDPNDAHEHGSDHECLRPIGDAQTEHLNNMLRPNGIAEHCPVGNRGSENYDPHQSPEWGMTSRTTMLTNWNTDRHEDHGLDPVVLACLADPEITDRDRIAFALRELRILGYDVEACPVDWTRPQMISSLEDSVWMAFGRPSPSRLQHRLTRIARRAKLSDGEDEDDALSCFLEELYGADALYDHEEYAFLQEPYEFHFRGEPPLVEAIFQAVGFATSLGLSVRDDGSETDHVIKIAPPKMGSA